MKNKECELPGKFKITADFYSPSLDEIVYGTAEVYIVKVLYNKPMTIVFWNDGTKTMTRLAEGDIYSPETGLAMCILKKIHGKDETHNLFMSWLPKENETEVTLKDVRRALK